MVRRVSVVVVLVMVALGLAAAAKERKKGELAAAELTNFRLGPDHARWLVGPIAHLASREEIAAYLGLASDAEAEAFVTGFWARRDADARLFTKTTRERFTERAEAADRLYTEGIHLGRRTDRGTVFVLYGPPAASSFETTADPRDPPIEVWHYDAETTGLDGSAPKRLYTFARPHGSTVTVRFVPRGRFLPP